MKTNNDKDKIFISAPKACKELEIVIGIKLIDQPSKEQLEPSEGLRGRNFLNQIENHIIDIIKRAINGEYKLASNFDIKARDLHQQVARSQVMRILKNKTKLLRLLSEDGSKQEGAEKAKKIITNLAARNLLTEKELTIGKSTKLCIGLVKPRISSPS